MRSTVRHSRRCLLFVLKYSVCREILRLTKLIVDSHVQVSATNIIYLCNIRETNTKQRGNFVVSFGQRRSVPARRRLAVCCDDDDEMRMILLLLLLSSSSSFIRVEFDEKQLSYADTEFTLLITTFLIRFRIRFSFKLFGI